MPGEGLEPSTSTFLNKRPIHHIEFIRAHKNRVYERGVISR